MNQTSYKYYDDEDVVCAKTAATLINRSVSWLNDDRSSGRVLIPFSQPIPRARVQYKIADLKAFCARGRVDFRFDRV